MTLPTNAAFLRLSKRAETSARETLIDTFVDVGPLFTLLSSRDHQILFGRRGTGKTHALSFLADSREREADVVVLIDLRNMGSNGGLYGDTSRPLHERATGLLIDVLTEIHEGLYQTFLSHEEGIDLAEAGPALDALAEALTQVRVLGDVQKESNATSNSKNVDGTKASVGIQSSGPTLAIEASRGSEEASSRGRSEIRRGRELLYVDFGSTGAAFRKLTSLLRHRHLWVLLDEWSSVPIALQPYLADLLRRSLFPITGLTVKLAAIEQRSEFQLRADQGDYVGIEVGADASADISLDDFMVFENDEERAKGSFGT